MKRIIVAASIAACALLSTNVLAQTSAAPQTAQMSKASVRAANRMLAKKVREALGKAHPAIPTEGIAVLAKSGSVTLVGEVESQDQVDEAGKVAASVEGVTKLTNNLGLAERGM